MKSNVLKIMIIDNETQYHEDYRYFFQTYTDYKLVGMYTSVKVALLNFNSVNPDIIVSEVALPEIGGIEAIKHFRKLNANIKVIMLSADSDFDQVKVACQNPSKIL